MFIELTSPQGKPILVLHSAIECIYDQNSDHMQKLLTEVRLASGCSQFVRELPQYIKQEVYRANHPDILKAQTNAEKRFYTPPESIPAASVQVPYKRIPPRKKS